MDESSYISAGVLVTYLRSWRSINRALPNLNEWECRFLLDQERDGKNRASFVLRLHARLNRLRAAREREEIAK